jgi:hypothetical protein
MPATYRLTQSGACAHCGAYGGSQHRLPNCPEVPQTRFQRGHVPGAARDARISQVIRAWQQHERNPLERLS